MSKASTTYDALIARIEAVLPSHKRLPKPYRIDQNSERFLKQGFAVQILTGSNTGKQISCNLILAREFLVILTRRDFGRQLQRDHKEVTEKELLEDLFLVIKDVENSPGLDSPDVITTDYVNDTGIVNIFADKENYLQMGAILRIQYQEDLT